MNDLLVKYIEYDVLGVAIGCMKRFDENIMEEQVNFKIFRIFLFGFLAFIHSGSNLAAAVFRRYFDF